MPLMKDEDGSFRLFLGDVGMFSYQSGINAASFVSSDRENTLSGIFFENYVAAELIAKGNPLFYWRGKSSCELEFIIEKNGEVIPIEVKAGNAATKSLDSFIEEFTPTIAFKLIGGNVGVVDKKFTIPHFLAMFI